MDVGRIASKQTHHFPHGLGGYTQRRTAPTGMACTNGAADRVMQQDHIAVGGEYHQRQMRRIGYHTVHRGIVPLLPQSFSCIRFRDVAHPILMDLLGQHHALRIRSHGGAESAVVFADVFHVVSPANPQIQTVPRRGGNAARTGGKAVAYAAESVGGQIGDAVFGVGVEHSTSLDTFCALT